MSDTDLLLQIDKKLDKVLSRQIKIMKVLHLVPVTSNEEKAIQILQRKNMAEAVKVNNELNVLENKPSEGDPSLGIDVILNESQSEVYEDIIGTDFITPYVEEAK